MNLEKREEKITFIGHEKGVNAVTVTPNSKYAISASDDRTVSLWDLEKETEKITLKEHDEWVMAVTATADGKYAIPASFDRTIRV